MTSYNRPYLENDSVSKTRELFTDYGISCVTDLDEHGKFVYRGSDELMKYAASHPILPLTSKPQKVLLPLKDRVMGHCLEDNKRMKSYSNKVRFIRSHKKRIKHYEITEDLLAAVEVDRENRVNDETAELTVDDYMANWFKDLMTLYSEIKDNTGPKFNNYRYAGGCLAALPKDDSHFFTVSAERNNFKTIQLRQVAQRSEGLLQAYDIHSIKLPDTVYGVQGRQVQGVDLCSVQTGEQCYLYKIQTESDLLTLQQIRQTTKRGICSVDLSEYIPGECIMVDEDGNCYLSSDDKLDKFAESLEPRFQVTDPWRQVQYGSHPRQVLYADQSVVQMLDLRVPNSEGHDLFALPSKLLHNRERIRLCGRHPTSPFYHIIATDYNLMVMDERYSNYPVLKWDHMSSTPPQYMSSIQHDPSLHSDNFIYIANQFPGDVHGFRFSVSGSQPPTAVSRPHRAAQIEDLCLWPQFVADCLNYDMLRERLNLSLAGMACIPWKKGHAVLQLTCHGDIFHQVFLPTEAPQDITFGAGLMSDNLKPLPVAVEMAKSWIDLWVTQTKQQIHNHAITREINMDQWGILAYRKPHKSCCVCRPDLGHMPGLLEGARSTDYCSTCMMNIPEGPDFIQSIEKDRIMPSHPSCPENLDPVEELPKVTALTKLICCHWDGDFESNKEDIMKEWDKEVVVKRKSLKAKKKLPEMTEESVIERITGRSSQQTDTDITQTQTSSISSDEGEGVEVQVESAEHSGTLEPETRGSQRKQSSLSRNKKHVNQEVFENLELLNSGGSIVTEIASPGKSDIADALESVSSFESRTFGSEKTKGKSLKLAKKARTGAEKVPVNSKPQASSSQVMEELTENLQPAAFKIPSSVKKSKRKRVSAEVSMVDSESVNTGSEILFSSPEEGIQLEHNDSSGDCSSVLSVVDLPGLKVSRPVSSRPKDSAKIEEQQGPSQEDSMTVSVTKKAKLKPPGSSIKKKLHFAGF